MNKFKVFFILSIVLNIGFIIILLVMLATKPQKTQSETPTLSQYGISQIDELICGIDDIVINKINYEKTKYGDYILCELNINDGGDTFQQNLKSKNFIIDNDDAFASAKNIKRLYRKSTHTPYEDDLMHHFTCRVYIAEGNTVYILIT